MAIRFFYLIRDFVAGCIVKILIIIGLHQYMTRTLLARGASLLIQITYGEKITLLVKEDYVFVLSTSFLSLKCNMNGTSFVLRYMPKGVIVPM